MAVLESFVGYASIEMGPRPISAGSLPWSRRVRLSRISACDDAFRKLCWRIMRLVTSTEAAFSSFSPENNECVVRPVYNLAEVQPVSAIARPKCGLVQYRWIGDFMHVAHAHINVRPGIRFS